MIVKVDVPPKVLWALSEKAEREGVTVSDLLVTAATSPAARTTYIPPNETTHERRVRELWQTGLCDADIGNDLGITAAAVGRVRRKFKLPANRRSSPTAQAARLAAQHQAEKRSA